MPSLKACRFECEITLVSRTIAESLGRTPGFIFVHPARAQESDAEKALDSQVKDDESVAHPPSFRTDCLEVLPLQPADGEFLEGSYLPIVGCTEVHGKENIWLLQALVCIHLVNRCQQTNEVPG